MMCPIEKETHPDMVAMAQAWEEQLNHLSDCLLQRVEDQKKIIQHFLMEPTLRSVTNLPESMDTSMSRQTSPASDRDSSCLGRSRISNSMRVKIEPMDASRSRQTSPASESPSSWLGQNGITNSRKLKIVEDITDLEHAKNTSLLSGLLSSVCSSVEERAIAVVSSHRVLGASYSASLVQTKSWKVFFVLLIILNVGWFFCAADVSMKNALLTYDGHATHFLLDWIPRGRLCFPCIFFAGVCCGGLRHVFIS